MPVAPTPISDCLNRLSQTRTPSLAHHLPMTVSGKRVIQRKPEKVKGCRAFAARPSPRAITFPDFIAHLCSLPTPSCPSVVTMVVPRRRPTSAWTLLLCGAICMESADQTCVHMRLVRRRLFTGSPLPGFYRGGRRASHCLDRPVAACHGRTPRRVRSSLALVAEDRHRLWA